MSARTGSRSAARVYKPRQTMGAAPQAVQVIVWKDVIVLLIVVAVVLVLALSIVVGGGSGHQQLW
jgi:hypothetical protein